ncbi:vitrin isoform X1 [Canis lupus familiaris]|uniref:Vitrin n=2 Tax=Canis lupus familiaris TaxID=9615 RepID=A0A8C0Z5Q0_CANLF|nr:vitrin isoform X1 [Canis lupus familiaris]XP_022260337.2 vitrin isoform X1 [Canis lupus familiaris]XP_022260338.2 vitrin isoform X1 [Canis lupus familiaris]XP_038547158.1 vitrin isoform X1 [Canis lupus familiaris]XP_038547159.1 vitrin isoform X1 [Canis lupus familiaris]XP_038547160.1 vitrin isoform X1 [Canis lupus familiaris]
MGIVVLTMKASVIEMFLVLLVTGIHSNKDTTKKIKRPKFNVPQINCDVKAGKIINPEFVVKCPAGCQDPKYHVYGTDIYASYSSVCGAAIHSGVLDNSGGKIVVRKVAGQSGYKGSYSNGIQSLSLPRWRESFIVSEGKPQKDVTYPSALTYSSSKSPTAKTGEATKAYQKPSVPGTTAQPVTLMQVTGATASEASHTSLPKPSPSAVSTTSSLRSQPMGHRSWELDLWSTSSDASGQNSPRANAGEMDLWKPGSVLLDAGFVPKEELSTQSLEPVSQGDPNCKIDLSFLIDGSSGIGKRRFRIQKQFLADVAQTLDIGPAGPLMGVVQYGDNPAAQFNLRTHMNSRDLKTAIEKITQRGGLSNAGRAISYVTKNFFSKANGNRGGAPNVAVVIVDGWPTDKVEEASRFARESGINIFFITIEGATENEKQYVTEPNFSNKAVCRTNGFYSLNVQSWFSLHKTVQPLVKRVCDTDRLACSKTCLNSADIGFVIDGSSSVGTGNFRTVLQFVANLSKEFEISDTDTRIGAVQYTYEQRLEFGFDDYNTKSDILNAIKRVGYWSGGTSTGAAINYALEQLFKKSKPNKRKLMILITDGRSYDDVRIPAMVAHHKGVITYAIGVAWAAQDELEVIATHPANDHSFFVDEFDHLYKFVPKVIQSICTEFNSQPRN